MLQFFRNYLTSWPVLLLFGLILVAFAVTGVNDPFGGGTPTGAVAQVGKRTVTEPDLLQAFDRALRNLRERDPTMNQARLAREGGVEALTQQLIGQAAMEELGRTAGIAASERAVGGVIAGIPAFQQGGRFDEATYRSVIAQQRLTDRQVRQSITGDLVREQLIKPVTGAVAVPAGMAEPYARLLLDVHKGALAVVPPATVAPPTEPEVAGWYAANKARFTVPERRAFRYAVIDKAAVAAAAEVPEAKIAEAFARDPAKYGGLATRRLEQVVVPDEAKAKAIAAAASSEGFAAAAQRLAGFGAADIALGEQSQAAFARATSAAVATAAFALPVGGVSQPVKSPFGWHVVRYAAPGAGAKTLAQARPQILADLRARAGDDAVADLVARIEDGVEDGKSFTDLARETGLTLVTQPAVTQAGTAPGAAPPAGDLPAVAAKAFRHEPGDGAVVEDIGGGKLIAIETTQVLPAAPPALDQVRPLATAAAARDKALKAARGKADAVAAAVKKGTPFAAALAAQGLAPPRPVTARRIDAAGQAPPIVQAFLATPPKTVRIEAGGDGWVLIHVEAITPGDLRAAPQLVEGSRREIATGLPAETAEAFARAAERAVGSSRNPGVIAAIRQRYSGQ